MGNDSLIFCRIGNTLPKDAIPTENSKKYGCHACEYIQDNKVHRCSGFIPFSGKDPQGDEIFKDSWRCTDEWKNILTLEDINVTRGAADQIGSLRDEMIKRQDSLHGILSITLQATKKVIENNIAELALGNATPHGADPKKLTSGTE